MNLSNLQYKSDRRFLKNFLNENVISKENEIFLLKKQQLQHNLKAIESKYQNLEKELTEEEALSNALEKEKKNLLKTEKQRYLGSQIEEKKIKEKEQEAEDIIESLILGIKDEEFRKELQESRSQKEKFECDDTSQKVIQRSQQIVEEIEREREKVRERSDQLVMELKETRKQFTREEYESKMLARENVKLDILSNISILKNAKENYRKLKIESDCYLKEEEDLQKSLLDEKRARLRKEDLYIERSLQLRERTMKKEIEEEKEKQYLNILTELMAEEEKLDNLRKDIQTLRRNQHRVAAQKILEERRKRRKIVKSRFDEMLKAESEVENLGNLIHQEEERALLLEYLPHVGRNISSQMIERLSQL